VADLQRSWIAPPTEVTRKAGLTIFVSTAFYVALLAPDTSGGGEKPSLFSEKSRLLMDHKKSSEEIRRLRTKVRTLRTKVRRLRTKINRLRTNKNRLRTNKNRLSGAGSAGVFRIVRLKTGLNPSLTRSVEGNEYEFLDVEGNECE